MKNTLILVALLSISGISKAQESPDSLAIKIGQMIMVGYSGTEIPANDPILEEIAGGKVGGIILFEKNIAAENAITGLKKLIGDLQNASPNNDLLIAIDQEGGKVNRLKSKYGFPESVTAEYLGQIDNIDSTRYYAAATARTLDELGINVNFAPVLDLATNPDNPVIVKYGRSFGAYPRQVYKHARIVIEEHSSRGIITAGKHFPGHGSSQSDTHFGIADVTNSWNKSELIPYKKLIKDGVLPGVMSAHIVNATLDADSLPGTLSKDVLQGLLREKLQFDGVVFSDDMQMHAITKHYGLATAIELGVNAGLNMIIFSNNIQNSENRTADVVYEIMIRLVREGKIPRQRIDESYDRIMKIKQQYLND